MSKHEYEEPAPHQVFAEAGLACHDDISLRTTFAHSGLRVEGPVLSRSDRVRRLARRAVAGGAITGLLGAASYLSPGNDFEYHPPADPQIDHIDENLNGVSWNMHNEAAQRVGQISALLRERQLDFMTLQEVNRADFGVLEQALPHDNVVFGRADALQHGGYGNVLITRQKPRDIETKKINGTTLIDSATRTITGASEDIMTADTALTNLKDGRQETREAIAETIRIAYQGKLIDVRLMTAHIAGSVMKDLHKQQLASLVAFVAHNTKAGRPGIFCGDLNANEAEVIPAFTKIGYYVTQLNRSTSVAQNKIIDHCATYDAGKIGLAEAEVLHSPATDHYPVAVHWHSKQTG